jgi:polysaccharide export outer membrane protein
MAAVIAVAGFAGCAATARADHPIPAAISVAGFPQWEANDPAYRLYPGDQVEISIVTAPELSRTVTIAPDGRVNLPLIAPVMVADRTSEEASADIAAAYGAVLREPKVEVAPRTFGSRQVFVGGEVGRPGLVEIGPGMDAMQAVIQAGGFLNGARRDHVLIMRRQPGQETGVYKADLTNRALRNGLADLGPLARYDVIYVPKSPVAQIGLFMQQYVRDALPISFSLYYNLAESDGWR